MRRIWAVVSVMAVTWTGTAFAQVEVNDADGLRAAIAAAQPGDVLQLAAGLYALDGNVTTSRAGAEGAPITVRGPDEGEAVLRFSRSDGGYVEGFKTQHQYWIFEGLTLEGDCADHSKCEHAWHVSGDADFLIIRNNIARNFNAHIKANRGGDGDNQVFPDDVLVEGNEFYSETVRDTANPVTPIDVVGGRRWRIRRNFIHDHAKGQGNGISYAAFLKGNSRDGVIEQNLVMCELIHQGRTRLGLSFGGGGSGPDPICEERICRPEHRNGLMANNIIANCPADVGVFVRQCDDCRILHNTIFNTTGIDFLEDSSGAVRNNILMGRIRDRQGSLTQKEDNLDRVSAEDFRAWFTDPDAGDFSLVGPDAPFIDAARLLDEVNDDYCGRARERARDIGAVEYTSDAPCDTRRPAMDEDPPPPPEDAGVPPDASVVDDASVDPDGTTRPDVGGTPGADGAPPAEDAGGSPEADAASADAAPPAADARAPSDDGECDDGGCSASGATPASALLFLGICLGLFRRRRGAAP